MKYYLMKGGVYCLIYIMNSDANLMFNSIIDSIDIVKDSEGNALWPLFNLNS